MSEHISLGEFIERLFVGLFLPFILAHSVVSVWNMIKDPWGVTYVWLLVTTQPFHSYTIISLSAIFVILYFYFFRGLEPIRHVFASISLSLFRPYG